MNPLKICKERNKQKYFKKRVTDINKKFNNF